MKEGGGGRPFIFMQNTPIGEVTNSLLYARRMTPILSYKVLSFFCLKLKILVTTELTREASLRSWDGFRLFYSLTLRQRVGFRLFSPLSLPQGIKKST